MRARRFIRRFCAEVRRDFPRYWYLMLLGLLLDTLVLYGLYIMLSALATTLAGL